MNNFMKLFLRNSLKIIINSMANLIITKLEFTLEHIGDLNLKFKY